MITCRILTDSEAKRYVDFLKERTYESRSMYFGFAATVDSVEFVLAPTLTKLSTNRFIVAENEQFEIVGSLHIADMSENQAEFGVMVHEDYRGQGISSQLMEYALTWCQNRGKSKVYMHCLGHNKPIIHLVKKHGLLVERELGDADASVELPPSNIFSLQHEAIIKNTNAFAYTVNNLLSFGKILQAA